MLSHWFERSYHSVVDRVLSFEDGGLTSNASSSHCGDMSASEINTCLMNYRPNEDAKVRLFCFPYAGGSAAVFSPWADRLLPHVDMWTIEYPGRGLRRRERATTRMDMLVADIVRHLLPHLKMPFAVFGHSMGAIVAFEVLRQLPNTAQSHMLSLFASGCRGPSLRSRRRQCHDLPDVEFIDELRSLNGTPEEILTDHDLLRLLLPTLRADFQASETYRYRTGPKLPCPVFAYGGASDADVKRQDLEAWCHESDEACVVRIFPGDHFFPNTAQEALLRVLLRDLLQCKAQL
jgi:medium-chain acyl-[acyl-carrier-protein] hydrolase